jgi:hypothetical protein
VGQHRASANREVEKQRSNGLYPVERHDVLDEGVVALDFCFLRLAPREHIPESGSESLNPLFGENERLIQRLTRSATGYTVCAVANPGVRQGIRLRPGIFGGELLHAIIH